ncbi:helix-turn-helix transcriptional regulator [Rathayibacter sp. ZW T2_19]|uniref:Helix-turn-helix transcriptional regulator n=1 Tax=Rathayibacter rubneri TaxID=2950106 RepID=A0A9X2IT78_9MICO|nr:helix-turn-helix transcriptional regulator [Rathayibacter rubneri]MCM6762702.1 helix-turn-helix transcriptional regulator [Rathayibacter rubneri]
MNEDADRSVRSEIAGNDFDEALSLLQGEYNGGGFTAGRTGEDFSYRYTSVGDDELTLRGNLFRGSIRGTIRTEGEYIVSWITAGSGALDLTGDAVRLDHGRPAMFVTGRPAEFDFADHRQNLMHFDGEFLERVAAEHEGSSGPLLFDTRSRPTGEALQRWAGTVATVARVIQDPDSPALLRSEANRSAAIALLDTFPHIGLAVSTPLALPTSDRLRAAIEYLHAHAHLPVRMEDVAAAAGLSVRVLQSSFRRELDVTPLDHLRRIRLDRVHTELRAGEAGTVTVAEVAHRWGFAHLGRFSASYERRFGEYPKSTLGSD